MRAASWLREGRRPADDLSAFEGSGRSGLDCGAADVFAFMARLIVMAAAHKGQPATVRFTGYYYCLKTSLALARFFVHYQYKTDNSSTALYHVDDCTLGY